MKLTILNVAYPLAPVGPDAVGGAEQVLTFLDRTLTEQGHRSIVIACEGSKTAGRLIPTPAVRGLLGSHLQDEALRNHREAIEEALRCWEIDVVHFHGIDFASYLPRPGTPVLATLHLPPDRYPPETFYLDRPDVYLHCVSRTQRQACPPCANMMSEIENGVPVEALRATYRKGDYVMSLGRVCWEKGFHVGLDAARKAGANFLLAGDVFPYSSHQDFFNNVLRPKLDRQRRFIGPVNFLQKRRLLSGAKAVLVPSLVPETSSLVAMEALASGTPVIAFRIGALPDIVDDGRTGFLVDDPDEMAAAIQSVDTLDPAECRAEAEARFSQERMARKYLAVYEDLAGRRTSPPAVGEEVRTYAA